MTYDNNGNLQTITDASGTTTYTWNARNQLTGISGPSVNATFVYDGLGRREKKTVNGSLTEFLYDRLNPVQETSGATILANILPGLPVDEFLTRTDAVAGTTSNFLTDALRSPLAVTDNNGVVQTEYTYEPFGKTTYTGSSNNSSYLYTSRENDGDGLHYFRSRYYSATLQRFLKEDALDVTLPGENLYLYVYNKPLDLVDPLGLYGLAFGFSFTAVANNVLGKAYGGGAGFYVGTDGAGFYTTKTTSGDGWLGGIGGQVSSFDGSDPGGTTNTFQVDAVVVGFGFNYDDNHNIGGFQRGFGGIGGGAAFTRERTTATCWLFCKNKSKTAGS